MPKVTQSVNGETGITVQGIESNFQDSLSTICIISENIKSILKRNKNIKGLTLNIGITDVFNLLILSHVLTFSKFATINVYFKSRKKLIRNKNLAIKMLKVLEKFPGGET